MRIRGQADIDVSISEGGYIRLKQRGSDTAEEQIIEFAPAYGTKVVEAISELQDFAQQKFEKAALVED
jgi:hypothetical protein